MRDQEHKRALIMRLRRIEGQIRGVQQLIENEAPCESIAQQLSAARNALEKAFYTMVSCMLEQQVSGEPDRAGLQAEVRKVAELLTRYS
jgi:DNA-binding FrmR family transcriptional regulator